MVSGALNVHEPVLILSEEINERVIMNDAENNDREYYPIVYDDATFFIANKKDKCSINAFQKNENIIPELFNLKQRIFSFSVDGNSIFYTASKGENIASLYRFDRFTKEIEVSKKGKSI